MKVESDFTPNKFFDFLHVSHYNYRSVVFSELLNFYDIAKY